MNNHCVITSIFILLIYIQIEVLVNAAEHSRPINFLSTPIQSLQRALQSNIHYTLTLTRLIAPLIIQRTVHPSLLLCDTQKSTPTISTHTVNVGNGRILFVDSMLATGPAPGHSVYAASKAFVSSFAQVAYFPDKYKHFHIERVYAVKSSHFPVLHNILFVVVIAPGAPATGRASNRRDTWDRALPEYTQTTSRINHVC